MSIGDTFMAVVMIGIGVAIIFFFPLMSTADKTDDITAQTIQTATTEFANNVRTTGVLSRTDYDNFVLTLASTGNAYDIDITLLILDENPAKKNTIEGVVTIGNNVYYALYTTQVLEKLESGDITLKEGDMILVTVKNINDTIWQQLRNAFYKVTGNNASIITAEESGIVTTTPN